MGENADEIAALLKRGARGVDNPASHLSGDDMCQGGFAQSRRSVEQDVVSGLSPALRGCQQDGERGLDVPLPDVLVERARAE